MHGARHKPWSTLTPGRPGVVSSVWPRNPTSENSCTSASTAVDQKLDKVLEVLLNVRERSGVEYSVVSQFEFLTFSIRTWLRISSTTLASGCVASRTMPLLGVSSFVPCKRRMSSRSLLRLPQSASGRLSSRSLRVSASMSKMKISSKRAMNCFKFREPPQKKVTSSS
jgi:hypothetical protein